MLYLVEKLWFTSQNNHIIKQGLSSLLFVRWAVVWGAEKLAPFILCFCLQTLDSMRGYLRVDNINCNDYYYI